MIREWIKTGAAAVLSRCLAGGMRVPFIAGYHRVVEDFAASASASIPSSLISVRMLEKHLDSIGRRFHFVTLDELGARMESGDIRNQHLAAITFDDGYRDFYELAFPLLKRKGIPAAVFVVADLVGTTRIQTHDKLYALLARRGTGAFAATRRLIESLPEEGIQRAISKLEGESSISEATFRPFHALTWEMLERVHKAGITVGSHTRSHVLIPNESGERAAQELSGSRQQLESRLGGGITHFAYPSGWFDTASVTAVAKAGYRFAYTTCTHRDARNPLLTMPRAPLWENSCIDARGRFSESMMSCQIHRVFDVVSGCRQSHARNRGRNDG
jgi:peptidoglycan/xylan/chitin deacetylase (PgdA/CDA1 family)